LTSIPGTVTARRMGRPPMNVKETKVRLNDDQPERIEALVGKNRMAEFIREAVERELKRREKKAVNNSGT
jgi:Arc/MetJ-type ribon-helix-helix transcriptional regulator